MDSASIYSAIIDSLEQQIAVIDQDGNIVYVNRAWKEFGSENGLAVTFNSVDSNYLKVCLAAAANGDSLAAEIVQGIRDITNGTRDSFYCEYPCHSPDTKRWFMMRAKSLQGYSSTLFVISHQNITERKLAEERIAHLALHDPLTGLSNRQHFVEVLDNEWRRSLRTQQPISLIIFDIDHFKHYNDALGHPAGDQCLIEVSRVLQRFSHRPSDLAVRYGGEEFVLVLGDTGCAEAQSIAEAVRAAIYDLNLVYGETKPITISAGVASCVPDKGQDASMLLKDADKALYRAKREGRNRVVDGSSDKGYV